MAITIEMLDKGWRAGLVTLQGDPRNSEGEGVVCRIGEYWFYFAGSEGENMTVDEYMRDIPKDDILKEILDALNGLNERTKNSSRIYNYYEAVLKSADDAKNNNEDKKTKICIGANHVSVEEAAKKICKKLDYKTAKLISQDTLSLSMHDTYDDSMLYIFEIEVPAKDAAKIQRALKGTDIYFSIGTGRESKTEPDPIDRISSDIQDTICKTFSDIDIADIIRRRLVKSIEDAIDESCKYGSIPDVIRQKIDDSIVPVLSNIDFGQYVSNLDVALSDLAGELSVKTNNRIVNNFKTLVSEDIPESKTKTIEDLLSEYVKFAAEEVDESDLETDPDDESVYGKIICRMEITRLDHDNPDRVGRFAISFTTETPNGSDQETAYGSRLNACFELSRWPGINKSDEYSIDLHIPPSLRVLSNLSTFESKLMALSRENVKIIMTESDAKAGTIVRTARPNEIPY